MEEKVLEQEELKKSIVESVQDSKEDSEYSEAEYLEVKKDIQQFVTGVSAMLDNHPLLKNKNFGLFYQHGRLGYVDLDLFAKNIDIDKLTKKAKEEKSIDKI